MAAAGAGGASTLQYLSLTAPAIAPSKVQKSPPEGWVKLIAASTIHTARCPALVAVMLYVLGPVVQPWLDAWPYPAWTLFVGGTVVLHELLYWGFAGAFFAFDKYGLFQAYKLPRTGSQAPSQELLSRTWKTALKDHFSGQIIGLAAIFPLFMWGGMSTAGDVPGGRTVFWHMFVSAASLELLFYVTHRALHHPRWYAKIHKQHHEFVGTVSFAAEYSHWAEHLISNEIPTALVPILLGFHITEWWAWLAWRLMSTYESHSGYCFMWSNGSATQYHDFHHTTNIGNYGSGPLWDYLGGTATTLWESAHSSYAKRFNHFWWQ